ncbi:formylmethanofuran dehydrogenase [Alicyclobacillaceae bacterium I2511]|jgi:formylmethanofuran dehydrogenase subunit E|nr:formylmethanofuran dehydrogenase [Alicyclobacillaceae bacterium I2511]
MLEIPEWVWEFHGHHCPFMPIGFRMGVIAMRELGIDKAKDHGVFAFPEIGVGHPQTCMADGIQASTGCTYGKMMIERTNYGKIAFTLYTPEKRALRVAAQPGFLDELGAFEFFDYRKKGIEPSEIPWEVTRPAVEYVLNTPENEAFRITRPAGIEFSRPKNSFTKVRCDACGEYVFERYLRTRDGKNLCIPCAGYLKEETNVTP